MGFSVKNNMNVSFTIIPNNFIDEYMVKANGEFVKIYLYVQSQIQANREQNLSLSVIADKFECTEKDVQRAFAYWEKEGLLSLEMEETAQPLEPQTSTIPKPLELETIKTSPSLKEQPVKSFQPLESQMAKTSVIPDTKAMPSPHRNLESSYKVPFKANLSPTELQTEIETAGLSQLVYMADTYFGRPLTCTDLNTLFYFHDQLHFSVELIEFLIEYCVSNDKRNMRYIESVALSWHEKHIKTVEEAKAQIQSHNKNYYSVMKALGIHNRSPIPSESELIKKWFQTYNFELPIILEACKRTIQKTHQPSFAYTDKILSSWYTSKVQTLDDIKALDEEYQLTNPTYIKKGTNSSKPENRFHNFDQRNYDFDALEKQFDQQFFFQINHKNG
ncbi:MAG: DnaD domain protein [Lachnospiraceae bacterium]